MQINYTQNGGQLYYGMDDFIGLVPGYASGNYPKIGRGASWLVGINPFLFGPGVLCPGLLGTSFDANPTKIAAIISNGVVDRSGATANAWLIEAGALIHRITGIIGTEVVSSTSPFPATLGAGTQIAGGTDHSGHTSFVGEDIITFRTAINSIAAAVDDYIFYSYNDGTDGDVGAVADNPANAAAFRDNVFSKIISPSAALSSANPHPMIVGDDRKLYVADGGTLHQITSAAASADPTVSTFSTLVPTGYQIQSFTKTGTHLILFAHRSGESTINPLAQGNAMAIFWDYSSLNPDYIFDLSDNEVTAGFNWNGVIGCFTQGRVNEFANVGYRSKLQIFEGGRFVPKFNFSQTAPVHGGVDIVNNMVVWGSGGVLYSYGAPYPELPARVNKIGTGASTGNGMVKALNGTEIFMSTGSAANNEVFNQATTYLATANWSGLTAEPVFPRGKKGKVTQVEIGFYSTASGGRVLDLVLDTDYGNVSTTVFDDIATITAGKQILRRNVSSASAQLPTFHALKPSFNYAAGSGSGSAPLVAYLKIYFDFIEVQG